MLNWSKIDTVLLDMDGTLLDLHYDNYFWLTVIPEQYARKHKISLDEAKADILHRYQQVHGQINWYCLDYWQQQLDLPIMALKRDIQHLIRIREDVPPFLTELRKAGKQLIMLTNAHPDCAMLKFEHTAILYPSLTKFLIHCIKPAFGSNALNFSNVSSCLCSQISL